MGSKDGLNLSKDAKKLANDFKEEFKLSDFEALSLALKAEQNELIKISFNISNSDSHPTNLEAIAIALGYK